MRRSSSVVDAFPLTHFSYLFAVSGYPHLAATMARHPAMPMFRTFSVLKIKSILYYQAELAHLGEELSDIEEEDRRCADAPRRGLSADFYAFQNAGMTQHPRPVGTTPPPTPKEAKTRQWRLVCKIRSVLESYREIATNFRRAVDSNG